MAILLKPSYLHYLRQDIPAGIVVFLVALPLCLGVALASGAPLFSGLVAGMVGGIIVAWVSGSQLSVSGPAAGLTAIVFNAINDMGSYPGFLLAVILAGLLQLILGSLKAGIVSAYFPSSVIKGMLAAIGIILIMKQLPHAVGYDASFEGDESYMQETALSTAEELWNAFDRVSASATIVSGVSLLILMLWESAFIKRTAVLKFIPGALVAVMWGVLYNTIALAKAPVWAISDKHLVALPVADGLTGFFALFQAPDFSFITNPHTYGVAVTLAIIASLETLLSLEAVDKMDPLKRVSPTNRELIAQGLGNITSGFLGGLPITAVIVRSAANVNAGAKTCVSSFVHGVLLLTSTLFFANYLNTIPLACLAAILLQTGYKLAKPSLFKQFFRKGWSQFLPFIITIMAILLTDLLKGITIGIAVGLYFVMRAHYHAAITLAQMDDNYLLKFHKDASFVTRPLLRQHLAKIAPNSTIIIDGSKIRFIDHDILETIDDFIQMAADLNISVQSIGLIGKEDTS
jgi:MFS superfamily sulfate permease-like transporter